MKLSVRLTPRGRADRIADVADAASGPALKVSVTAPPEKGKANAALIALLAKTWRLPKSSIAIAGGETSRSKTVTIAGDPQELIERLTEWAGKQDG